jgi:hypothetical protein
MMFFLKLYYKYTKNFFSVYTSMDLGLWWF